MRIYEVVLWKRDRTKKDGIAHTKDKELGYYTHGQLTEMIDSLAEYADNLDHLQITVREAEFNNSEFELEQ